MGIGSDCVKARREAQISWVVDAEGRRLPETSSWNRRLRGAEISVIFRCCRHAIHVCRGLVVAIDFIEFGANAHNLETALKSARHDAADRVSAPPRDQPLHGRSRPPHHTAPYSRAPHPASWRARRTRERTISQSHERAGARAPRDAAVRPPRTATREREAAARGPRRGRAWAEERPGVHREGNIGSRAHELPAHSAHHGPGGRPQRISARRQARATPYARAPPVREGADEEGGEQEGSGSGGKDEKRRMQGDVKWKRRRGGRGGGPSRACSPARLARVLLDAAQRFLPETSSAKRYYRSVGVSVHRVLSVWRDTVRALSFVGSRSSCVPRCIDGGGGGGGPGELRAGGGGALVVGVAGTGAGGEVGRERGPMSDMTAGWEEGVWWCLTDVSGWDPTKIQR
ncbi:hypothetical protein DFH09DRAFT_1067876 [Mycena vulgaris]|nr:hypothetical protein DFH09DRAFT_1067876 [Mycena vulgaris]